MEQYFGAVPPAGEHTVLNAYAVGRTDERSKTFLIPCILTSGVMNMVVGSCGHVVEGQRGGQLVELSTALAGARSASSTCPQLGFGRVGLAGACSPIVPRATLIKVPISGTTSDFDPLIAQCEISALRLA
jgi:hypothetical protein